MLACDQNQVYMKMIEQNKKINTIRVHKKNDFINFLFFTEK